MRYGHTKHSRHSFSKLRLIIQEFAKDENVIPKILKIIDFERKGNKDLIQDMNLELSRLHCVYADPNIGGINKTERDEFVNENISSFYKKWKNKVGHCFNSKIGE